MSFDQWKQAVMAGDVAAVSQLLENNVALRGRINEQIFPFDSSAVFQCRENLDLIDVLLLHGADLNLKTGWWAGGFGILEGVSPEVADPLIERGATVDIWSAVGLDRVDAVRDILNGSLALVTAPGGDGKHPLL